MNYTKYFLFLSMASIMVSGSFSGLPAAYAGDTISLHDLGVLQLAAHDLFNVNRGDGSSAAVATDFENGKLDLSTLFFDMTSPTHEPFSNADIAKGGEPRNRENIILFSVASDIGQTYVDNVLINGKSEYTARQIALADYHMRFNEAYENAFGESRPAAIDECVTMTENLAFRTVHDFLPGFIRLDTALPNNVIDTNDAEFLTIFDPDLGIPAGLGFTPPFTDPAMNPNNHVGPLLAFELDQPTSEVDGMFDSQFLNIDIFIPPSTMIVLDLLAADKSFGVQFNIDKYSSPETSFQHFLNELALDESYESDQDVMFEIRNLIAKGYGHGCYIGGEIIPIQTTSLLLAGAQTNAVWIMSALAVIGSVAFGTLYITSRKHENS